MGVTVYSAHTNLDRAAGGVNDRLAEALGAIDIVVPEGQFFIRTGALARPMGPDEFTAYVADRLGATTARAVGNPPACVRRIAVGGGASGDRLDVVAGTGVDAFVVGEMKHHQAREAEERGIFTVIAGHFETEWPVMPFLETYLQNALHDLQYDVEIKLTDANRSPFRSV
jgi:putative NIF3 family GTP cyclohydrolase 1 type 2